MGVDNDARVVFVERRRTDNSVTQDNLCYRMVVDLGCAQKYLK